jgi:S1-C subfamily serine protease
MRGRRSGCWRWQRRGSRRARAARCRFRTLPSRSFGTKRVVVITGAIQTSADVNPGNSGGGLVDLNGDVLGIPTLGLADPQLGAVPGIGFAIPSNTVVAVARQLIGHHAG